ncbi:TIR domain-containing protein [Desulfosarcina sp. OttesenSCG-928-A07]|nr:TIR domain-containing protein [Desulfosarcina sp. OttesenSCG-928-G17]MDL2328854.1 TIR domain-containing protein [Desulfosarcina sp. OttesenSCG-928-A07]
MSSYNYFGMKNTIPRHKTFISFHHNDDYYKREFEKKWGEQFDGFISKAVNDGDINPSLSTDSIRQKIRDDFIADATVTLVLVGQGTWRRKHVDWEIASSIRDTKRNPRTGLLGILLPSYLERSPSSVNDLIRFKLTEGGSFYNPYTIPPRLHDNIECGFAKIYPWPSSPQDLRSWIHEAFQRRDTCLPNNSRDSFANNRSETQMEWR